MSEIPHAMTELGQEGLLIAWLSGGGGGGGRISCITELGPKKIVYHKDSRGVCVWCGGGGVQCMTELDQKKFHLSQRHGDRVGGRSHA